MLHLPKHHRVVLILILLFVSSAHANNKQFRVYDGTLYHSKPDLESYGLEPIKIIYASALWDKGEDRGPVPKNSNIEKNVNLILSKNYKLICLDIEHWPIKGKNNVESLDKYRTTVRKFKSKLQNISVGYYGLLPHRNYWASIDKHDSRKKIEWKRLNNQLDQFSQEVDVIFPSLYTFYENSVQWKQYAIEHLKEAKQYGKLVYAFIWPLYHESNLLRGRTYIGDDYWRMQLDTVRQYADGVVIWGGWNFKDRKPDKWDDRSSWWVTTKRFLDENKIYIE